jgi:hypothetical protein
MAMGQRTTACRDRRRSSFNQASASPLFAAACRNT